MQRTERTSTRRLRSSAQPAITPSSARQHSRSATHSGRGSSEKQQRGRGRENSGSRRLSDRCRCDAPARLQPHLTHRRLDNAVTHTRRSIHPQLDCQSCFEPFSPVIGPRYPRILAPCAHTFCTECIAKQLQARGPNDFRCLTHNQRVTISKAEDVKANFALIDLLEVIAQDADHQVVDERTKPPSCSECDAPSVWYCKTDDACFCDAHRISCHSSKAQSTHAIIPVTDRTAIVVPKCLTHKSKDLELWCNQCSVLCCTMCERSGVHKEHADKLVPVDDVVMLHRNTIQRLAEEAAEWSAGQLDKEAQTLVQLHAEYYASARRVQEQLSKQQSDIVCAVGARFAILHKEVQAQLALGFKHIELRVDDLTMNRSRAAMVSEEAARVLRMSDHALLAHTASVQQSMVRVRKSWVEYQLSSLLPQKMELKSAPEFLLHEIAVAGLIDQSWAQVDQGKPIPSVSRALSISAHRSADRAQVQQELGQLQLSAKSTEQAQYRRQIEQLDQIKQLEKKCADGEQQRRALEASFQQQIRDLEQREKSGEAQSQRLFEQLGALQQHCAALESARQQCLSDLESHVPSVTCKYCNESARMAADPVKCVNKSAVDGLHAWRGGQKGSALVQVWRNMQAR